MDDGDFIEVYDGVLDAATCAALVRRFEASGGAARGETGGGVNTAVKDSWDITISNRPEWADAEQALNLAMLEGLKRYLRRYPYAVLGPLWLRMRDERSGEMRQLGPDDVAALGDDRLRALATKAFRPGHVNLQKYLADEGGYPRWHCELYPPQNDPACESLHRTLLWTIYLNDGFGAGETEFLHQQRRITPKAGSILLAPAGFTHTHRGNMPRGGDKYIATSWVLFQRGDVVHAAR